METIALIIMSGLLPIMTISAFIIGYNVNANRKIFKPKAEQRELSADEKMLQRIDEATVYEKTEII